MFKNLKKINREVIKMNKEEYQKLFSELEKKQAVLKEKANEQNYLLDERLELFQELQDLKNQYNSIIFLNSFVVLQLHYFFVLSLPPFYEFDS